MTEDEYWGLLEFRICLEIQRVEDWKRTGLWCDGIYPSDYHLHQDQPRVEGRAWMGRGPKHQELWRFTLLLTPGALPEGEDVPWSLYLPAESLTKWLHLDIEGKYLEVEPSAAIPVHREGNGR